jgi:glycosyltransferase involved in cell wall biosynthesis
VKIAIVTYSLMIGGIETVIFNQAKYFIEGGNKVTVIETLKIGVWKPYFEENNIRVISYIPNPVFSKKNHVKKIAKYLKEYEVILLHDAPYAQSILGLLPEKTIVLPVLHSDLDSMVKNAIGNFGQWNKIIYVGPYLKDVLLSEGRLRKDQIHNITNGIIIPHDRLEEEPCNGKRRKFIYIGRLEHIQKAVIFIPDIVKKVLLKQEIEAVNIYGEGQSKEALESRIKELALEEIIKIHGTLEHEDVYRILKNHDFLLMPSFFEGHPIVLLEAMACRTIPFVSDLKGSTDFVIKHEVNGFLCKAAHIEDFSEKIIEALGRKDLPEIAERARTSVIEQFSLEAMGNQYFAIITEEAIKEQNITRTNKICMDLLGDLPSIPIFMIRPVRKLLRILHLWRVRDIKS